MSHSHGLASSRLASANDPLCDGHRRVLRAIQQYQAEHGYPPTLREIAALAGLRAWSSAYYHIQTLIKLGYLAPRDNPRAPWRILRELAVPAVGPDPRRPDGTVTESEPVP